MFENAPLSDAACADPEAKVKEPINNDIAAMNWPRRARGTRITLNSTKVPKRPSDEKVLTKPRSPEACWQLLASDSPGESCGTPRASVSDMAFFDLPLEQLQNLQSSVTKPSDLEAFWSTPIDMEMRRPLEPRIVPLETPLRTFDVYDVSWVGYGGQRL